MSSKRHSMPVGPRPLQLAHGPFSDALPSAPLSAVSSFSPSPLTPSTPTTPNGGPRRQSSITYNPSTRPAHSAGHRSTLVRSNSVGGSLDRRNTVPERSPVTLAEKHADLLHFIAQKESKCLELRSQLAMHEAELLQLKRKWERIVSRGFTSPHNTSLASTSTSSGTPSGSSLENSPNPTSANGGAVLDGIREGVQGMGRFIAGLSPTTTSYPSLDSVLPRGGTHSKNSSMSTMATSTTGKSSASTRLSLSSASSLGEEPEPSTPADEEDPDAQVLMVHDTGATPTMSPNPAFNARRQQQQRDRELRLRAGGAGDSSAEAEEDFFFASAQAQAAMSTPPPTARPIAARRPASTSAIPGMGLVESVAPVSAWVGTVGKKWEELQRVPTFAKNTKRASLLFSDIAHALQVGPTPSHSPSPSRSPTISSSPMASSTSLSLLDDDDDSAAMMPDAPSLKPAPAPALKITPRTHQQQQPQSPLSLSKSKVPPKPKPPQTQTQTQTLDDDGEEWNW
ncbi:hypothetical protein B0H19DRAFT_670606 [Mycena capillaripes]|nr:hypothetical protein B0H19DRAFT_670606 [Mycena capillaripes]